MDIIRSKALFHLVILLPLFMSGCGSKFKDAYNLSVGRPLISTPPPPPAPPSSDASFLPMLKAGVDASVSKGATRLSVLNAVTAAAYKSEAGVNKVLVTTKTIDGLEPYADAQYCLNYCSKGVEGNKAPTYKADENKVWIPTNCQAYIVQAAVNHCIDRTRRAVAGAIGSEAISLVISGLASIAGFALSAPSALFTGVSGLISTTAENFKNPTQPTNKSMYESAAIYAQFNQNIPLTEQQDRNNYYAGLWNAAGLACPTNLLLQDFRMEEIPYKEKSLQDNNSQDNKCGDGK